MITIEKLRKRRGWNQKTLAALAGMSQGHLSDLETGREMLTVDKAKRLASVLEFRGPPALIRQGQEAVHVAFKAKTTTEVADVATEVARLPKAALLKLRSQAQGATKVFLDAVIVEKFGESAAGDGVSTPEEDGPRRDAFGRALPKLADHERDSFGRALEKDKDHGRDATGRARPRKDS